MNAVEAPSKLVDWVQAVIPEIASAYDYVPASKPEGLPDLVVEVARTELVRDGGDRFGIAAIQQVFVDVYTCNLSIMVDNADPDAAATALRGYRDQLIADARANPTLRGNVHVCSPFMVADFTQPFVEYEDGTRGREMTLTIEIGELVEAPYVATKIKLVSSKKARSAVSIDGKRFVLDEPVEVPDKLAKELLSGSDRLPGFKFEELKEPKKEPEKGAPTTAGDGEQEDHLMALTGFPFPYDIENLLGGAVRVLYAPTTVAVPGDISDVIDMDGGGYAAQTGWIDLGATSEEFSYSRGFDVEGWEIQQVAGNVIEEVTDISRTITVSFADFRPEHLAMIENAPNPETIAAVAGASAQEKVAFGSFQSFTRYRFAYIARRPIQAGAVVQSDAVERGRFFMGVAYSAQIAADEVELAQAKGELTAAGVTFTLFPEEGEPSGEEFGAWYDEQAGTIA